MPEPEGLTATSATLTCAQVILIDNIQKCLLHTKHGNNCNSKAIHQSKKVEVYGS